MRRLLLVVLLAVFVLAAPAGATTTVAQSPAALTITGDDTASTLRVTAPTSGTLAVEDTTGEGIAAGAGCAASGSTVTCPSSPRITATLGGGNDDYKASVDPPQTIDGGAGNDTVEAGYGADAIVGGGGNDNLNGFRGDDTVDGQEGDDTVDGWDGSDTVIGGPGKDNLLGDGATIYAPGNDTIQARDGEVDSIDCGTGADSAVVDTTDVVNACTTVDRPAGPAPAPPTAPTPPGSSAPVATVVKAKPRKAPALGKVAKGSALKVDVTASASCTATVSLKVAAGQAKKLGFARKAKTLGTSTAVLTAGKATRVSVTVKRSIRKALRKARKVKATLAVSCGAGATDTASVTLKR